MPGNGSPVGERWGATSQTILSFVLRAAAIVQGKPPRFVAIDSLRKARKSRHRTGQFSMRGLLMALLAFDSSGHNVHHWAGRVGASPRSSKTAFLVKKTGKTTAKTV